VVDADGPSLPFHVLGQDPAEQLSGPLGSADHARTLTVGEDRRVPSLVTAHSGDMVQSEPTAEQLQDSTWWMVLVYPTITTPVSVWRLMGFLKSIPKNVQEQAMVDGYSRLGAFLRAVCRWCSPASSRWWCSRSR
jgi:hypothetical protein